MEEEGLIKIRGAMKLRGELPIRGVELAPWAERGPTDLCTENAAADASPKN
jgi:hypothetical protein